MATKPVFPCDSPPALCDQEPNPSTEFSSEAADGTTFIGLAWSPNLPLLGKPFDVFACEAIVDSQVSQLDADLAAARAALVCANPCAVIFGNRTQTAITQCVDGTLSFFVIPPGQFTALNQLLADRMAFTFGEKFLLAHGVCVSDMSPSTVCSGGAFSAFIVATGKDSPFTFLLESGGLPPGVSMTALGTNKLRISGVPTQVGAFPFSIRATSAVGTFVIKQYAINVVTIVTSVLPDGFSNTAYSQQLIAFDPLTTAPVWSLQSGALPAGLTLSSSGLISGTPTTPATSNFTVASMIDGVTCTKAFSIKVQGMNWNLLVWSLISNEAGGGAGGTVTGIYNGNTFIVAAKGNGAPSGLTRAFGTANYAGPALNCKVVCTVTADTTSGMGFFIQQDGLNRLSISTANLTPPGTYTFNFSLLLTAGSVITVIGLTDIGQPSRCFVLSFDGNLGSFTGVISNV